jgi:hypothetical protein
MKKYIKPEITVVKLQQMQMLCNSEVADPDCHDEVGGSTQFTRKYDAWEEW